MRHQSADRIRNCQSFAAAAVANYSDQNSVPHDHQVRYVGLHCPPRGHFLSGERVERRLAAVLAADVAGYSRLMGRDEEGTLANLKSLRNTLVDPAIAAHRGRIVNTPGAR